MDHQHLEKLLEILRSNQVRVYKTEQLYLELEAPPQAYSWQPTTESGVGPDFRVEVQSVEDSTIYDDPDLYIAGGDPKFSGEK